MDDKSTSSFSSSSLQTHYAAAKEKMALIYLQRCKDKKLYIACYREIRDELPGPQSSILLGDAYINIQEV